MDGLAGLIAKLHPLERQVLPVLARHLELSSIAKAAKLTEVEVMRALQWLENKDVLTIQIEKKKVIHLEKNGQAYKKDGLPEKKFLKVLDDSFKSLSIISKKAKLSREEATACVGLLKRKSAVEISQQEGFSCKITEEGKRLRVAELQEEQFLLHTFPKEFDEIHDRQIVEELRRRKDFLIIKEEKKVTVSLLPQGKEVLQEDLSAEVVNRLTPGMLKTGNWKDKTFRAYDVEINVPKTHPGKKHIDTEALEYIKQIWLDLGFKEMTGNYVQSAFWDLDALFVPQDHPAREMQDTFYLDGEAKLPPLWKKIKEVHESGGDTGSAGWRYTFSEHETKQILLRTHTTVLSAQTLSHLKKEDLPAKFFAVGRVFRNEALDWKHLFEFYQVEGIVVDPNANLKHLKGYLTQFYKKMGYTAVRMRPAHFPYTEPSLEVDVFHPIKKQWVELGGAGIFRPEVVKPLLGFECPVLAWGQGMARIIAEYWKIADIRELYKNDVKQLREMKLWLK
ncbi:phenylalanine--tRNA ligase subunit alpha [Candidatus Woesearchaeota archaeon]|nr:phenylalanine--tRNA ligase subunit alpha [Candidatus Woesearchaeota archaeon]